MIPVECILEMINSRQSQVLSNYIQLKEHTKRTNILNHKNNGIYSEYQIQKNDSYWTAYCSCVLYLIQIMGFKFAVLILYYQTFCHKQIKKPNTCSAQFKIIQPVQNHPSEI